MTFACNHESTSPITQYMPRGARTVEIPRGRMEYFMLDSNCTMTMRLYNVPKHRDVGFQSRISAHPGRQRQFLAWFEGLDTGMWDCRPLKSHILPVFRQRLHYDH